jgi:tRNA nucleotidyltransferase (CCA-adding enzyme)
MSNAEIFNLLNPFKTEIILYMMICTTSETAKKRISLYHTQLRNVAVSISGADLLDMGLPPGPLFSQMLQSVLEAKLNGRVETREDELAFVKNKATNFLDCIPPCV